MENSEIGKRIKQRRHDMEISVMDLVEATGLSKATLHRYENGDIKNIKIPVLRAIAFRLGVSVEWLMGETEILEQEMSNDKDIYILLEYTLKLIRSGYFMNKGEPVSEDVVKVIEATLEYQVKLLGLNNKE